MDSTKDPDSKDDLFLKFSGKVEIPKKLEIGHNFVTKIQGSITSITEADREDGGRVMYYKFEPIFVELITHMGETIKAKDPRGWSKKIRAALYRVWEANSDQRTAEEAYEATMREVMLNLGDLYEKARN